MLKRGRDKGWYAHTGRMAASAALMLVLGILLASLVSGDRELVRIENDTISQLIWWNNDSVKRIWGCDKCDNGDMACSLGSAIALEVGIPCGYMYKPADYFGYLDIDDKRKFGNSYKCEGAGTDTNPRYKWADTICDVKLDWESGIPDFAVVQESVESIKTTIDAYFVKETEWKGPPYWIHMHDPGPWGKNIDLERWVMPCDVEGEDWCRWTDCKQRIPCPCQIHVCPEAGGSWVWVDGVKTCAACKWGGTTIGCNADGRYDTGAICTCPPPVTNPGDPPQVVSCWIGPDYCRGITETENHLEKKCPCPAHTCPNIGACQDVNGDWRCTYCCACGTNADGTCTPCANPPSPIQDNYNCDGICSIWKIHRPISWCAGNVADGELGDSMYQWCCWECQAVYNASEDPDDPTSVTTLPDYCGWGGTRIQEYLSKSADYKYDNYALKRTKSGIDCNDDILWFDEPYVIGRWFGTMPKDVLLDGAAGTFWRGHDMVRDRYWKRNATDTEFWCSRPGYCSAESNTGPCQEADSDTRDAYDRPASRQHDPCTRCVIDDKRYWDGKPPCPKECHNYDLRYYRQFNVDTVWANIFKIVPEANHMYTDLPPDEFRPDTNALCFSNIPGRYKCSAGYVGEDCATKPCIDGLECTESVGPDIGTSVCCPTGTYYENYCCREETSNACTMYKSDCPEDKRSAATGDWGEFTGDYEGWLKENMFGIKQEYKYLIGIGEKGCEDDSDCAKYLNPEDYTDEREQHCSIAKGGTGGIPKDVLPNYCCPEDFEYDISRHCCMKKEAAVRIVEMYDRQNVYIAPWDAGQSWWDVGFCEEKYYDTGGEKCTYEEGPCRIYDRTGTEIKPDDEHYECAKNLRCSRSKNSNDVWDSACCRDEQEWNGKACVPVNTLTPWYATWTRSAGNPADNEGGGPIWVYSAAGANIPNGSESAGWDDVCTEDGRWTGGWYNEKCVPDIDGSHCRYCEGAWPYRCNPSPIWFEARNLGNSYQKGRLWGVCNGPFSGVDASIEPYDSFVFPQCDLEIFSKDANCGRDLDGVGDMADGTIADGGGGCFSPSSCNTLPPTTCHRGFTDPETEHKCNWQFQGHGTFENKPGCNAKVNLKNHTAVSPVEGDKSNPNNVKAQDLTPDLCARIQRKEVISESGYYPRDIPDNPESWFDYVVREMDENHGIVNVQTFTNHNKGRLNILPRTANPWTVLRDDKLEVSLGDSTRYINISMNYTIFNSIKRQDYIKGCMWLGCSRLEEVAVRYDRSICYEQCVAGTWSCVHADGLTSGSPPCCCTPQKRNEDPAGNQSWIDTTTGATMFAECVLDRNNPLAKGDCWACKSTQKLDCDGDGTPETERRIREEHNCNCQYACWGCWHMNAPRAMEYQPVTQDDASGKPQRVIEVINDTSSVKSKDYGDHIRVENPLSAGNAEAKITVDGMMVYGYPDIDLDKIPDTLPQHNAYAKGYLTFKVVDAEDEKIDMFGGIRMTIPDVVTFDVFAKQYPVSHDLSALQSTLPHEYILVQPDLAYLLRLNDMCYYRPGTSMSYQHQVSSSPFYLRWIFNTAKKHYAYYDVFSGHGTHYNLQMPVWLIDKASPTCLNYFDERSPNIPLYRDFHENEAWYYDYESVHVKKTNIEPELEFHSYEPKTLDNARVIAYQKTMEEVYARYAPDCEEEPYSLYSLSDCGNCPDMCSDVAETYCNGGQCDCRYRDAYREILPEDEEECQNVMDWTLSEIKKCEGPPSVYKSFCSDGVYHAFWMDEYQYMYMWNGAECEIKEIKKCEWKEVPPSSYTVILEPASTITKDDWDKAELTVFSNLRSLTVSPFGTEDPCTSQTHTETRGAFELSVEKPKPEWWYLEALGAVTPGTPVNLEVKSKDFCDISLSVSSGGATPASPTAMGGAISAFAGGPDTVYVEFKSPYAYASGWYKKGSTIKVTPVNGADIVATVRVISNAGFKRSIPFISQIKVAYSTPTCDYFMAHMWILVVVFVLLMSYRFFSGRVTDFKDWWDEYHGRK